MATDEWDDLFDDAPVEQTQTAAQQPVVTQPAAVAPSVAPVQQPVMKPVTRNTENTVKRLSLPKWAIAVAAVVPIVCLVIGVVIGVSTAPSKSTKSPVKKATAIKSQSSVIKNLESLKDAQLKAMTDKLSAVRQGSSSSDAKQKGYSLLAQDIAADQERIDKFLSSLYALKPTADTGAKETVRADIAKLMTESSGSTIAYDAVSGPSPAKMLRKAGTRSAPSIILPWKYTAKGAVYTVITPFSTDEGTSYAVSVIGVTAQSADGSAKNKGRAIYDFKFTGVLTGTEVGSVEKAYASMADKTDDKPASDDSKPSKNTSSETPSETSSE